MAEAKGSITTLDTIKSVLFASYPNFKRVPFEMIRYMHYDYFKDNREALMRFLKELSDIELVVVHLVDNNFTSYSKLDEEKRLIKGIVFAMRDDAFKSMKDAIEKKDKEFMAKFDTINAKLLK